MCLRDYSRSFFVILLSFSILFYSNACLAGTVLPFNGRANAAVAGVIQTKLAKMGFAANDPRVTATFEGVSAGITHVAVTLAVGGVVSVSWPALLIGAGVSAVVGGAISLTVGGLYKWLFGSTGVTTSGGAPGKPFVAPSGTSPLVVGGPYAISKDNVVVSNEEIAIVALYSSIPKRNQYANDTVQCGKVNYGTQWWCYLYNVNDQIHAGIDYDGNVVNGYFFAYTSGSPVASNTGSFDPRPPAFINVVPLTNGSGDQAVNNIPESLMTEAASPEMIAAAANTVWKNATSGLPWSASNPITPSDVSSWSSANPGSHPSVGDMSAPVTSGKPTLPASSNPGNPVTVNPGTSPDATPDVPSTPGKGEDINLGPDPNIGAPPLETTPTADKILAPLMSLMPTLKNFAVPSHSSVCPTGKFTVYGKVYAIDAQCTLLEANRSIIQAAMTLVFSIVGIFIVLKA